MRPARLVRGALALVLPLGLATGCGGDDGEPTRRLTVLAAASLRESFEEIAAAFEVAHPGIDVELSFDGSSALATQVAGGAPADVLASADRASVDEVVDGGHGDGEPVVFASNRLQIVVPEGNPAGIRSLADLAGNGPIALCAPEVPCGRYAAQVFASSGLAVPEASQEENVRGVLTKVALGEADAGIVYVTDTRTRDDVEGVDLPDDVNVVASYPAIALRDAPNPAGAAELLTFLTGTDAQAILAAHGFGPPPPVSDR